MQIFASLTILIAVLFCAFHPVMKKEIETSPEKEVKVKALLEAGIISIVPFVLWVVAIALNPSLLMVFVAVLSLLIGVFVLYTFFVKLTLSQTEPTVEETPIPTPSKTTQPYCYVKCPKCNRRNRAVKGQGEIEIICGGKECKHKFKANT